MLKDNKACVDPQLLQRFLQEQLDERDEATVLEHIDSCADCQKALEGVAAKASDWSAAQNQLTDHLEIDQPGFDIREETIGLGNRDRDLEMERLQDYMGPTDNPEMLGRLGSYEVCGLVGRGSTGVVVKAYDPRLNRFVAIKVLSPSFSSNGSARSRFEREGQAIAAVSHEHVVPVYAVDEYRGLPYTVMHYVAGGSLQQRIDRKGPLETCEVVRLGMQIANGLAAAHAQGIVHRDVKPANVMLEQSVDRAMVTDFGLARVADEAAMTRSGVIAGTPQYMSPEQARGESIDPRSDLFSLGSVMYAASTGRAPFRSESLFGVIKRVCDSQPRPIREVNPRIDEWLESFINRLQEKDRDDRFDSAQQVADLLGHELAHLNSPSFVAKPTREWFQPKKRAGRKVAGNLWPAAIAACLMMLIAGVAMINSDWFKKGDGNASAPPTGEAGNSAWMASLQDDEDDDASPSDEQKGSKKSDDQNDDWSDGTWNDKSDKTTFAKGKDKLALASEDETGLEGIAGQHVAVHRELPGGVVDGYSLYLPKSYGEDDRQYPVILFLGGGCCVGGEIDSMTGYGGLLAMMECADCSDCDCDSDCEGDCESDCDQESESDCSDCEDEDQFDEDTRTLLLDTFIVVSPHMIGGSFDERQYYNEEEAIQSILDEIQDNYQTDRRRVYLTGAGRGGHGAWGLASRMPGTFAAVAPVRGELTGITDYKALASTPLWTAHYRYDKDVDYSEAETAVEKIEEIRSVKFLVIDELDASESDYMDHDYVFTSMEDDCPSCWPNIYQSAPLFQWMLKYELGRGIGDQPNGRPRLGNR